MIPIDRAELERRLGGSYFLEPKSLMILTPYMVIASVVSMSVRFDGEFNGFQTLKEVWFQLVLANLLSLLTCWLVAWFIRDEVLQIKYGKVARLWQVLVISFCLGLLKGLTTGLFAFAFGAETDLYQAVGYRVLQTGFLGLWTLPAVALVLSTLERYREERDYVISQRVLELQKSGSETERDSNLIRSLVLQAEALLDEILELAKTNSKQAAESFDKQLHYLNESVVRPLSHSLWKKVDASIPRFGLQDQFALGIKNHPPSFFWITGLTFVITLGHHLVVLNPIDALIRTSVFAGLCGLGVWVTNSLMRINTKLVIPGYLLAPLVAAILAVEVTVEAFGALRGHEPFASIAVFYLMLLQMSVFVSFGASVISNKEELRRSRFFLEEAKATDFEARRVLASLRSREFAEVLHSEVQNQLLAAALKTKQRPMGQEELVAEVARIRALISGLMDSKPEGDESVERVLEMLRMRWGSFIELEVSVSDSLSGNTVVSGLAQALNEVITNSVRHGEAARVSIRIGTQEDNAVQVIISDDGKGCAKPIEGLGFKLLRQLSAGQFTFSTKSTGSETTLLLRSR